MALSDILTNDILDSYAQACCEMGKDLWYLAMERKHGHILMPSRGAFPILNHARTALDLQLAKYHNYDDSLYLKEMLSAHRFNEIWLPFTAHSPDGHVDSSLQRKHWCLVLKGILDGMDTPALICHRVFTRDLCNQRFDHTTADINRPKGLIIIDTVISGRAVTEISLALEESGIHNYIFLLAVDDNGKSMRHPYKTHIDTLVATNKAILYNMVRIFTEDSNPGLTGVTAVVFPQITKFLHENQAMGTTVGYWHLEVARRADGMNLPFTVTSAVTNVAVYRRILTLIEKTDLHYNFEDGSHEKEALQKQEALGSEDLNLTRDFILPIVKNGVLSNAKIDLSITSSYIASVNLDESTVLEIGHRCLRSIESQLHRTT